MNYQGQVPKFPKFSIRFRSLGHFSQIPFFGLNKIETNEECIEKDFLFIDNTLKEPVENNFSDVDYFMLLKHKMFQWNSGSDHWWSLIHGLESIMLNVIKQGMKYFKRSF